MKTVLGTMCYSYWITFLKTPPKLKYGDIDIMWMFSKLCSVPIIRIVSQHGRDLAVKLEREIRNPVRL
jgi:hypothetical protein